MQYSAIVQEGKCSARGHETCKRGLKRTTGQEGTQEGNRARGQVVCKWNARSQAEYKRTGELIRFERVKKKRARGQEGKPSAGGDARGQVACKSAREKEDKWSARGRESTCKMGRKRATGQEGKWNVGGDTRGDARGDARGQAGRRASGPQEGT